MEIERNSASLLYQFRSILLGYWGEIFNNKPTKNLSCTCLTSMPSRRAGEHTISRANVFINDLNRYV